MIAALIRWSVANRFLVVLATLFLAAAGLWGVRTTPVDALPDLSDERQPKASTMTDPIYLDHNATTPVAPEVFAAMAPWLQEHFGNPSSSHAYGRRAAQAVTHAREQVAGLIGAQPQEITFTGCATEANNVCLPLILKVVRMMQWITALSRTSCTSRSPASAKPWPAPSGWRSWRCSRRARRPLRPSPPRSPST